MYLMLQGLSLSKIINFWKLRISELHLLTQLNDLLFVSMKSIWIRKH
jgi:hypothetical protein